MRLSAEARRLLAALAHKLSISQSAVMEIALRALSSTEGVPMTDEISTILKGLQTVFALQQTIEPLSPRAQVHVVQLANALHDTLDRYRQDHKDATPSLFPVALVNTLTALYEKRDATKRKRHA
jgi:hypothetical protein